MTHEEQKLADAEELRDSPQQEDFLIRDDGEKETSVIAPTDNNLDFKLLADTRHEFQGGDVTDGDLVQVPQMHSVKY
jgi:hypothetical protein